MAQRLERLLLLVPFGWCISANVLIQPLIFKISDLGLQVANRLFGRFLTVLLFEACAVFRFVFLA